MMHHEVGISVVSIQLGLLNIDYDKVSQYTTCFPAATCGWFVEAL
jgi:hypothetical protein